MYKWIDDCLYGLIEVFEAKDVYELYNCLEIQIKKLEADNILLQGNEAFYNRSYLNQEVVFIRDDLNSESEKFILAHELGHAILHTNVYIAAYNHKLVNLGKYEKHADYFAFKLLDVPLDEIELNEFTIDQISSTLNVPRKLIEYKYMNR